MSQAGFKKRVYSVLGGHRTLREARALHWTSEEERARSEPNARGLESFVVPLGVAVPARGEAPAPSALARRFPALAGHRVLLFLGRVHPKKQPEVLIRALASLRAPFPDAVLVIAGPGEAAYLESLRALAAEVGVSGAVHFPGVLQGAAVAEAFAGAACLVLPSRQENFAVAVAEAMAAGCPVVVSPEVALSGVITSARAGWVAPATPDAFAAALFAALGDEEGRLAAGARARQAVLDRFTWPAVARQLIGAYERLLA